MILLLSLGFGLGVLAVVLAAEVQSAGNRRLIQKYRAEAARNFTYQDSTYK